MMNKKHNLLSADNLLKKNVNNKEYIEVLESGGLAFCSEISEWKNREDILMNEYHLNKILELNEIDRKIEDIKIDDFTRRLLYQNIILVEYIKDDKGLNNE
jgi:hypothetical protein